MQGLSPAPASFEAIFDDGSPLLAAFVSWISGARVSGTPGSSFSSGMRDWRALLADIYVPSWLDRDLFISHGFVVLLSDLLIARETTVRVTSLGVPALAPFLACFSWVDHAPGALKDSIRAALATVNLPSGDIYNKMHHALLPRSTKHGSGEYYTPVNLARLMVSVAFVPGQAAIDPSCGSGTFLTCLISSILDSGLDAGGKRAAIARLAGFDKNPLAIFMAAVNARVLLARHGIAGAFPDLELVDALFPPPGKGPYDLVIGNPPWIVLGGIENAAYKETLKAVAVGLGVYHGGKNASNLEIASLFLISYQAMLVPGGSIFFVLPNSIITGSQHAKIRLFPGFDHVVAWKFTRQPFNIHSTCILARRGKPGGAGRGHEVVFETIRVEPGPGEDLLFTRAGAETHVPASIDIDDATGAVTGVGRLIPAGEADAMLPLGPSPYADMFYKGAQVFPRLMFFVDVQDPSPGSSASTGTVTIVPSSRVQPKKHARWTGAPYTRAGVEPSMLFKVAKSTFLVPFKLLGCLDAFLPLHRDVDRGTATMLDVPDLPPAARAHFNHLQAVYASNMKNGASHETLRDIINYQNCLVNPRQLATRKIVYNGGGSIVKAALVHGDVIVDYSMFYMPVPGLDEGYYLLGCLNAPALTGTVKRLGSTGFAGSLRNIVKHPLDVPWPRFDPADATHVAIARVARILEARVDELVRDARQAMARSRMGIQNAIFSDGACAARLAELDALVKELLG